MRDVNIDHDSIIYRAHINWTCGTYSRNIPFKVMLPDWIPLCVSVWVYNLWLCYKVWGWIGVGTLNDTLFECNWKVLEGFIWVLGTNIFYPSDNWKSSRYSCHLCAHEFICSSHGDCYHMSSKRWDMSNEQ